MKLRFLAALAASGVISSVLLTAADARATNVTELPDNGSEQMGRGGAWVARASDPLATMFNPAGLAGQPTRVTIQNNVIFEHTCFTRIKAANDTTLDPLAGPGGAYPRACNDISPTLNPQIGATIKLTERLGLGLLVIGPSAGAEKTFPDFVPDGGGQLQAAPNRYLLIRQAGTIVFPTVGVGYEILDNLRVGASVSWGIARLKLASATVSLNTDNTTPGNDTRANVQVQDYFVPGFTLGTLWSPTPNLDVAGWYKLSDAIRARGDVGTAANYYTRQNAAGVDKGVRYGDTTFEDCGTGLSTRACAGGDNATVKLVIPMEAKLGLRYHKPRAAAGDVHVRDPLATDVFDIEADLTWANNSAADTIQIRFPGDATGKGTLPVAGVAGGEIPPNADQKRGYRDVIGVRVGGDYNVIPDTLALRAGTFFETSAASAQYQNIDFSASARFGLAVGGTYRIRFGQADRTSAVEIMAGFGHVFVAEQSRTDPNASGSTAIAGTSCNRVTPIAGTQTCEDGTERYRTRWPVNLGTITNALNVINVGVAYRF
jgi:long-chain fatty acid transport protein